MGSTYTPPSGNTPQGQQQAQSIAAMSAQVASGTPMNSQQSQAIQNGYMGAQQNMVALNTPQQRQQTLNDTTSLAPMQANYDQLAQQLAQYDKAVLMPQFQGQNPGMPSDLPQNPYVTFGDVSYLTPGTAGQGVYNANPGYALSAQADQGNNIASLLNTITKGMATSLQQGKDIYGGKMSSAATILKGFSDLMDKDAALKMRQMELAQARESKAQGVQDKNESKFFGLAQQIKDDFLSGKYSYGNPQEAWGKAWQELKTLKDRIAPTLPDQDIDAFLGGSAKNQNGKWTGTGNASGDVLGSLGAVAGKKTGTSTNSTSINFGKQVVDSFNDDELNKLGPQNNVSKFLIEHAGGMGVDQGVVSLNQRFELLKQNTVKALQGSRMSDKDIQLAKNYIPAITDTPETARTKLSNLNNYLNTLSGSSSNSQSSGGETRIVNGITYQKVPGGWQKVK